MIFFNLSWNISNSFVPIKQFLLSLHLTHLSDIYVKVIINMFKIGLDIGSTTAKIVVIDENDK